MTLDVPRSPAQYVKTRVLLSDGGVPVLVVANSTEMDLQNIEVRVELGWANGQTERLGRAIRALPAGRQVQVKLPSRDLQLVRQASAATAAQVVSSSRR